MTSYSLKNYNLSAKQVAQFPFVSPYAIRHWEQSNAEPKLKWGHRAIALIQFCPILGPIASLIERLAVKIYKKCHQQSSTPKEIRLTEKLVELNQEKTPFTPMIPNVHNQQEAQLQPNEQISKETQPQPNPSPVLTPIVRQEPKLQSLDKKPVEAKPAQMNDVKAAYKIAKAKEDQWKLDFKKMMLEQNQSAFVRKSEEDIDQLVQQHRDEILAAYKALEKCDIPEEGIHYFPSQDFIFKMDKVPGVIFKMKRAVSKDDDSLQRRYQHTQEARLKTAAFKHLIIPNCKFYEKLGNEDVKLIIEEELPLVKSNLSRQEELYKFLAEDAETLPLLNQFLEELTLAAFEILLCDFKFNNYPLLPSGVALIDLGDNGLAESPIKELLQKIIPPVCFDTIQKVIERKDPELAKGINFDAIKQARIKKLERQKLREASYEKRFISGAEPVVVAENQLAGLSQDHAELIKITIQVLNEHLADKDVSLLNRRRIKLFSNDFMRHPNEVVRQRFTEICIRFAPSEPVHKVIKSAFDFLQNKKIITRYKNDPYFFTVYI